MDSRVIDVEPARVSVCEAAEELDYEAVFTALDRWLRGSDSYREVKLRPILRGIVCSLYQAGNPVAEARGQHADEAITNALGAL